MTVRQDAGPGETARPPFEDDVARSARDRCHFLKTIAHSEPDMTGQKTGSMRIGLLRLKRTVRGKRGTVILDGVPSSSTSSNVVFLDHPRELRNQIYTEICNDLKRKGLRWEDAAPKTDTQTPESTAKDLTRAPEDFNDEYRARMEACKPAVFLYCAIMRICRQVHAEFAPLMYREPMQIDSTNGQDWRIAYIRCTRASCDRYS